MKVKPIVTHTKENNFEPFEDWVATALSLELLGDPLIYQRLMKLDPDTVTEDIMHELEDLIKTS